MHHDRNGPASVHQADAPSKFRLRPDFCPARLRRFIEQRLIRPVIFWCAVVLFDIEQLRHRFSAG
jgi:hypothetical protein